jgi:AraC-like DNA-binding protein/mannose-6-phosphate isomerase-like protein (cupin superfamily)
MLKPREVNWVKTSEIETQINAEGVHIWPFEGELPIDVRFLAIERRPVRMNRHDYFELLYCHSGEVAFQVQERNVTIKKGDLFIIGSTLFHRAIENGHARMEVVVVYFLPELIYRDGIIDEEATEYLMPFLNQNDSFMHVVPAETGLPLQALHWIEQIHKEMPALTSEARLAVKTYLRMVLMLLRKHYKDTQRIKGVFTRRQRDIERLRPLFEFIDRHFAERISLADASTVVGMSSSHFKRFFRQVTGQPFVTHLNRFRVARAQGLLALTDKSIAEVSQEVGFCDQSYFGIVFRKFVHMPPLLYRQRHRAGVQEEKLGPNQLALPKDFIPPPTRDGMSHEGWERRSTPRLA